jgi:hypothetical protein
LTDSSRLFGCRCRTAVSCLPQVLQWSTNHNIESFSQGLRGGFSPLAARCQFRRGVSPTTAGRGEGRHSRQLRYPKSVATALRSGANPQSAIPAKPVFAAVRFNADSIAASAPQTRPARR